MLSSIPSFCPLDASSTSHPSYGNEKYLQTLLNIPCRGRNVPGWEPLVRVSTLLGLGQEQPLCHQFPSGAECLGTQRLWAASTAWRLLGAPGWTAVASPAGGIAALPLAQGPVLSILGSKVVASYALTFSPQFPVFLEWPGNKGENSPLVVLRWLHVYQLNEQQYIWLLNCKGKYYTPGFNRIYLWSGWAS